MPFYLLLFIYFWPTSNSWEEVEREMYYIIIFISKLFEIVIYENFIYFNKIIIMKICS